jgi:hypothetical protein
VPAHGYAAASATSGTSASHQPNRSQRGTQALAAKNASVPAKPRNSHAW